MSVTLKVKKWFKVSHERGEFTVEIEDNWISIGTQCQIPCEDIKAFISALNILVDSVPKNKYLVTIANEWFFDGDGDDSYEVITHYTDHDGITTVRFRDHIRKNDCEITSLSSYYKGISVEPTE